MNITFSNPVSSVCITKNSLPLPNYLIRMKQVIHLVKIFAEKSKWQNIYFALWLLIKRCQLKV